MKPACTHTHGQTFTHTQLLAVSSYVTYCSKRSPPTESDVVRGRHWDTNLNGEIQSVPIHKCQISMMDLCISIFTLQHLPVTLMSNHVWVTDGRRAPDCGWPIISWKLQSASVVALFCQEVINKANQQHSDSYLMLHNANTAKEQ